ncbi:hypothetical protein EI555_002589 [Monodon monoceros]|uniref:Histone H2A n=1 Tax=Monodon monoceros TaxID=40151 RepID=A0A4U1F701_MONMO|nr:hypothetical protein EI555_002589 [Monodon monoceros]
MCVGMVNKVGKPSVKGNYAERLAAGLPVYLAAVLESITAQILELAGNVCRDNKKTRIIPCHLQLAVRNDEELNNLLGGVTHSGWRLDEHLRRAAAQEDREPPSQNAGQVIHVEVTVEQSKRLVKEDTKGSFQSHVNYH